MAHVQELLSLRGKTALITGATGHLGSAMATALAEAGARVIVSSRDRERAEEVVRHLPVEDGRRHENIALDHLDEASIADGFSEAVERGGAVDILVNNGHAALGADWESVTAEQFSEHLTNATGYFLLARRHDRENAASGTTIITDGNFLPCPKSYALLKHRVLLPACNIFSVVIDGEFVPCYFSPPVSITWIAAS